MIIGRYNIIINLLFNIMSVHTCLMQLSNDNQEYVSWEMTNLYKVADLD